MRNYDHQKIENKWRSEWEKGKVYQTPEGVTREEKMYILPQLPYPSGSGLHVGHAEVYSACDIYARYERMAGKKVLQVIGWDAFGLPAENYAIKTNIHPRKNTDQAIENFREQIKSLGISIDWDRSVGSHTPDYYKWTQWFFLLMYERGLAYREKQIVNWCDTDKTVLANEQVLDGKCERCGNDVEQKEMEQWYLRITEYADRLINDLDKVDWPSETVKRQRDWIGRSEGIDIAYEVAGKDFKVTCFTTTPVNFGATFIVVAPEYKNLDKLVTPEQKAEVDKYVASAKEKTALERQKDEKEKTGVFTGSYAINHLNGEQIPIWVADFVVASFGTGAVQGCPAHDSRDFEFAKKFDIPIYRVVEGKEGQTAKVVDPQTETYDQVKIGKGVKRKMVNSEMFNGLPFDEAMKKTMDYFEEKGWGRRIVNFKLHDWSVSRQRFWGAPIPMLRNESLLGENEKYKGKPDFFINIHAFESSASKHYHPWIDSELKSEGVKSINNDMPGGSNPKSVEWLSTITQAVGENSFENSVISGRSLGAWTAFQIAEKNKVRKLILVAPSTPFKKTIENWKQHISPEAFPNLMEFVGGEGGNVDFSKVSENAGEIVIFLGTDDPYIDLVTAEEFYRARLPKARIIRVREAGHFTEDKGFKQFPSLLREILAPVRVDVRKLTVEDLPVILPDDVDFKPTGQSPLTYSPSFQEGIETTYGKNWKREVDTLDTFMCSSWYYFRYLDPHNDKAFASEEALKNWMPVDFYLGGPEHVNGHLLYSRFFTKVLYDAGYIDFDEPFKVHRHQGTILGEDNRKMSKRWGNVINPTDVVAKYGADTARVYEMFMGPLELDKAWSDTAVQGVRRFLARVYSFSEQDKIDGEVRPLLHKLIKKIGEDIPKLRFNVAIAEFMKTMNEFEANPQLVSKQEWQIFLKLLAPFAPFMTEELWGEVGQSSSIHFESWPEYEPNKIIEEKIKMPVQVNGKLRESLEIELGASEDKVRELAIELENVKRHLEGKEIRKTIFVQDKIINFVV